MLRCERARRMEDAGRVDGAGIRLVLLERRGTRDPEVRQADRRKERGRRSPEQDRHGVLAVRLAALVEALVWPETAGCRLGESAEDRLPVVAQGVALQRRGERVPPREVRADRRRVEGRAVRELDSLA